MSIEVILQIILLIKTSIVLVGWLFYKLLTWRKGIGKVIGHCCLRNGCLPTFIKVLKKELRDENISL